MNILKPSLLACVSKFGLLAGVFALAGAVVDAGAQNLVQNGSFTANASSFVTYPGYANNGANPASIANWFQLYTGNVGVNGAAVRIPQGSPFGPSNPGGNTFAFIQIPGGHSPPAGIAQYLPALAPNTTYQVSFDVAARSGETHDLFRVQIADSSTVFFTTETGANDLPCNGTNFVHYNFTFATAQAFNGTPAIQLYNLSPVSESVDFANVAVALALLPSFPAAGQNVPLDLINPASLSWTQVPGAVSYEIYSGTSSNGVATATTNTTGLYLGQTSVPTFNPGSLQPNTTYYWRVDFVQAGGAVVKGTVFGFTTGSTMVDLMEDTWVATDALQRSLPGNAECGSPRTNRPVGLFYFLDQASHDDYGSGASWDVSQWIAAHPFSDPHNPWADEPVFTQTPWGIYWWGQPAVGYYDPADPWVLRRNLALIAHAGVDVLIFDYSNATTYDTQLYALCDMIRQMRFEGCQINLKIAFLTHTLSGTTATYLYNTLYGPGQYSDLWFYWQGKPLILGEVAGSGGVDIVPSSTVQNFFTWRTSWANEANLHDDWDWIQTTTPQNCGYDTRADLPEQMAVTCGGWAGGWPQSGGWVNTNIGRSFANHAEPAYDNYDLPATGTQGQGLFFAEELHYGLKYDPQFVYITGWNEWLAASLVAPSMCYTYLLADCCPAYGYYFEDEYNEEFSRDIEPTSGGHTDNYYFQMAAQNRLRKGVRPLPAVGAPKSIDLGGDFSQWTNVSPAYYDPANDTMWRNFPSAVSQAGTYVNNTGRNDLTVMKVARDTSNFYFMAQCSSNITTHTGSNWMVLFIDSDTNHATGWEGYDYAVNLGGVSAATTTLSRNTSTNDIWNWTVVRSDISYKVTGGQLMLAIPRTAIGLTNDPATFDFHWADNFQTNTIADFGINGDSAPDGRYNYRYQSQAPRKTILVQDDFENGRQTNIWGNTWVPDSRWALTTQLPYTGSYCAGYNITNGSLGNPLAATVNATNYSSMRLTFQYKLQNVQAATGVVVTYQGANGAVTITNLGQDLYYPSDQAWGYNERTNVWLRYSDVLRNTGSNAQFFTTNFTFSIVAAPLVSSSQSIWIDNFEITGITTNFVPPTLSIAMTSAGSVRLFWPASCTGYTLQGQTNTIHEGLTTNWFPVGGAISNQVTISTLPIPGCMFFRLVMAPSQ